MYRYRWWRSVPFNCATIQTSTLQRFPAHAKDKMLLQ
jgi:hypothetical protein